MGKYAQVRQNARYWDSITRREIAGGRDLISLVNIANRLKTIDLGSLLWRINFEMYQPAGIIASKEDLRGMFRLMAKYNADGHFASWGLVVRAGMFRINLAPPRK